MGCIGCKDRSQPPLLPREPASAQTPSAERGYPALSRGWKGKCPLLSPQRDTQNRDKDSLPGRHLRPRFAQWPWGRGRQGRGSRKRGTTAGFVCRRLAAREAGAFCSRVHPISGEPEPWEGSAGPLCPCLAPPQHPPGLLGPSNPAGSQHGVLGEGLAERRALSLEQGQGCGLRQLGAQKVSPP